MKLSPSSGWLVTAVGKLARSMNLGIDYSSMGDKQKALENYNEALPSSGRDGQPHWRG